MISGSSPNLNLTCPSPSEYFEMLNPTSRYFLSFSPFFINRVSIELMSCLINERNKLALYICIGRPHIFVQKILISRGIPSRNIYFMDMVPYISSDYFKPNSSKLYLADGGEPLKLPPIFKLYRIDQEVASLALSNIDIVIVDNISELSTFNTQNQISSFLETLYNACRSLKKGLLLFHLDDKPNDGLVKMASSLGLETLALPNDAFRNSNPPYPTFRS